MPLHTGSKLAVLGALYFSQGLPFGFFTQALPVMLRSEGVSLDRIGLTSLLALPWALKFLWAPLVDRRGSPRFGRRRSWIIPLQGTTIVLLLGLAATGEDANLHALMAAVFLLNLAAATQDIATDGLAVDLLAPEERGLANGLQVAGYRVGMIVGGGVLLILHDELGRRGLYLAMAALTALATLPVLAAREPPTVRPSPSAPASAPVLHFLRRPGATRVLVLLATYKVGDAFASSMLRPLLVDRGLDLGDLGWLLGTVGFVAGLVGALAGGVLVGRFGRRPTLVGCGLLQALSVAGYAYLAAAPRGPWTLYALTAAEHLAGGMATATLFTCMMDWCSRETSATDYTVQASTVVIATGVASVLAGVSAEALGYFPHFCLAALLGLGSVALVRLLFPSPAEGALLRAELPR